MSDTPRTDAEAQTCMDTSSEWHGEWVRLDFARQLERELNAASERIKQLEQALSVVCGGQVRPLASQQKSSASTR